MHRWIARYLLLVALVGTFGPLARAATTAPPHACCVRKALHHCHDSGGLETEQLVIRGTDCCNHECCRAVTSARWAHARPSAAASFAQNVEAYLDRSTPVSPNTEVSSFQSARAPPLFSIA
jgi:hypothetical protein